MGKKKENPVAQVPKEVVQTAQTGYQSSLQPTAAESEFTPMSQNFMNNYNQAAQRNMADYGDIMGQYQKFGKSLGGPTKFSYQTVKAQRPKELGESYGYLREAMPGYREFAETGGYSPQDIQELRARGISPIRSAYSNTMMELNRARALGGAGGAPNYIAALSRAQREMPEQMAEAMTGVNAQLADAVRQGKLAGLSGITNVGGTMGGLSSQEAARILQADLANQGADIQTQGMREQSLQNLRQMQLAGIGGQASMYGTTPGMASTFGNQALGAYQTRAGMEQARMQQGIGMLNAQLSAYGQVPGQQNVPWWQQALGVAGTVAPFFSDKNMKKNIRPVKGSVSEKLKKLPIYTWQYKGENTTHLGPIAQHFKKAFGIGDGKTLHPADIMGVVLASQKEAIANG